MLWAQTSAAILLSVGMVFVGAPSAPPLTWVVLVASDLFILGATACLYSALSIGRLSVVAPVAASYGGVTAILAAISGEQLAVLGWAGLAALLAGGILVARPPLDSTESNRRAGLLPAVVAAVLYGTGFWVQGRFVVQSVGSITTVWSYYALGALLMTIVTWRRGITLRPPVGRDLSVVLATGVFAVIAYLALTAGQSLGSVAIVTMLSSLASASAVMLAFFLLGETVTWSGWIGVGAIVVGLMLIHA
jgi:drug/metabolite transporter (DMT)-like permease